MTLTVDEVTFAFEAEDASIVKKGWPVGYFSTKHGQERELWMRDDGKNAEQPSHLPIMHQILDVFKRECTLKSRPPSLFPWIIFRGENHNQLTNFCLLLFTPIVHCCRKLKYDKLNERKAKKPFLVKDVTTIFNHAVSRL